MVEDVVTVDNGGYDCFSKTSHHWYCCEHSFRCSFLMCVSEMRMSHLSVAFAPAAVGLTVVEVVGLEELPDTGFWRPRVKYSC